MKSCFLVNTSQLMRNCFLHRKMLFPYHGNYVVQRM
jgi:hypothetical protein